MDQQPESQARPGGSAPEFRLEPLDPAREPEAAQLLARAFLDNPINRAVIGGNERRRMRANAYGMRTSLAASRRSSYRRLLVEGWKSVENTGTSGALLALDPGGYPVPPPPVGVQLRCLWGQGLGVMLRFGELYRELDDRHPRAPHAYLSLIAISPERRGRGLGRALLAAWLRNIDAQGWESYLETDRRELLRFYESAGFEIVGEMRAFDTPIWCMQRAATKRTTPAG